MCRVEGVENLSGIFNRFPHGQRTFQRRAVDQFHHQVVRADIVELANVGVIERRDGAGLAVESSRELGLRNLQRNNAVEASIARLPHLAHASRANGRDDFVRTEFRAGLQFHERLRIVSIEYTEAFATMNFVRFRAPCNGRLQTPPGLEGSNGSGLPRVPRITRSLAYLKVSPPMYQVIARKYRPQTFDDLLNQEHIITTLRNAIAQNRIAHGYIFSGQRGTGKTTTARIVARCLNCEKGPTDHPCGVCASCLEVTAGGSVDVIEIDAASNRGINEMRELRENVRYQPARDRYKIFIIDEAHQITSEAFNALLKTIEEPPPWAVFILCTTESHKIPATIASRCQHFSFRSVDFNDLIDRMREICVQEGIEADDEVLSVIAQAGEGSVRDSLSALDQAIACCGNKVDSAQVRALLGAFSLDAMAQVSTALSSQDGGAALALVDELERNGGSPQHFSREMSRYLRNLLVTKISGADSRLVTASPSARAEMARIAAAFSEEDLTRYLQLALDLFRDLQFSLQPRFHLEIGLLRMVQAGKLISIEDALAGIGTQPAEA